MSKREIERLIQLACEADKETETDHQNLNAIQMGDALKAFAQVSVTHGTVFDYAFARSRVLRRTELKLKVVYERIDG